MLKISKIIYFNQTSFHFGSLWNCSRIAVWVMWQSQVNFSSSIDNTDTISPCMKELFGTYQNTILHSFEALDQTRESLTCWRKLPIFGRFTAERSVKDSSKTPHVVKFMELYCEACLCHCCYIHCVQVSQVSKHSFWQKGDGVWGKRSEFWKR